jgi:hypothetical protein
MEPLSVAASVIAIVDISGKVFNLYQKYHWEVKGARKDIQSLYNEVISLRNILANVADLAEDPGWDKLSVLSLLNDQDGPVEQCRKDLMELLEKIKPDQGETKMKQFGLRA